MNNDDRRFDLVKIAFEVMVPHAIESTNARAFYEHKEAATRIVELVDAVLAEMEATKSIRNPAATLHVAGEDCGALLKRLGDSADTNMMSVVPAPPPATDTLEVLGKLRKEVRNVSDSNAREYSVAPEPKSQYAQGYLGGFNAAARCASACIDRAIREAGGDDSERNT